MILQYYIKKKKVIFPYSEQIQKHIHEDKIPPPG